MKFLNKIWQWFLTLEWFMKGLVILAILAFLSVITGNSNRDVSNIVAPESKSDTSVSSQAAKPQPVENKVDIMTESACEEFRPFLSEASKGVFTDEEIRLEIKKIYDIAKYSTDVDIVESATSLMAAATSGDSDAFLSAGTDFGNACVSKGQ